MHFSIRKTLILSAGFATTFGTLSSVHAHHSQAAYFDFEQEVEIEGVVSEFDFRNPHAYMYVDVEQGNGELVTWRIQFGNATGLRRRGWTPNIVEPGVRVTVRGRPSRDADEHAMAGAEIILPDGSELGSDLER